MNELWIDRLIKCCVLYLQETRKKVNNERCIVQQEFEFDAIGLTLTKYLLELIPLHPLKHTHKEI